MKKSVIDTDSGPIVLIIGTRPEGIKLMPLYRALKQAHAAPLICSTMQHDAMLTEVFDLFGVKPDFDLQIMRLGQDLFYLTQAVLQKTKELFIRIKPSMVIVQGDTTSSMAAALSAFYLNIPVMHIEAGLRTDDIYAPFPEEMNRRVIGSLATIHCAPTQLAVDNLKSFGIAQSSIYLTGNTVVDSLRIIQDAIRSDESILSATLKNKLVDYHAQNKKIVVLTAHRRESFDGGIDRIFNALKNFLMTHTDTVCFYPFHPNPRVIQAIADNNLSQVDRLIICEPMRYVDMVHLLSSCDLVLTDSGGIQEEAVSLGKPVLVLREKTERMEGVLAGKAQIVGTDQHEILEGLGSLYNRQFLQTSNQSIYGDGYAAEKIISILQTYKNLPYRQLQRVVQAPVAIHYSKNKEKEMSTICMIGLGYIGLPTAIVAVDHGLTVFGFDVDQQKIDKINAGDPVIHEPEIFEKLQYALGTGRLHTSTVMHPADFFIIAVPTPFKQNNSADLSYVYSAGESIAQVLTKGNVVIIESTIPVGTTQAFAQFLAEKTGLVAGTDFYIAHCPERVLPGNIFRELLENDRIIGGINQESVHAAKKLYAHFVTGNLYLTDAATAELVKLVENSSRDVQIAFANQVASMAYSIGLNPFEVIELANKHPRVQILKPGCGVGGHCIAVDPWFLVETFPEHSTLLHAARTVNDNKPLQVLQCTRSAVDEWKENAPNAPCSVAVFGLTYKADVDDLRESPALRIATLLSTWPDINLMVVEPHVHQSKMISLFGNKAVSVHHAIEHADIVLLLVGHNRFKAIDKKQLKNKKVLDFCGLLYEPKKFIDQKEQMFWPARSTMDFFASNSKSNAQAINQTVIKEETA